MSRGILDSKHRIYFASHAVLTSVATLFLVARFGAKRMKRLTWTWDDTLLVAALLLFYVCVVGSFIGGSAAGHVGHHISLATSQDVKITLVLLWALQLPHAAALTLIRISITILFMRIFYTSLFPKLRCAAYASAVSSIGLFFVVLVVNFTHCRPISQNWQTPLENPKYCYPMKPHTIVVTGWGLINDGIIWSLPHFVVWGLQLRLAHKIAITAIFALAFLNILMAIFRISSLMAVTFRGDITYDVVPAVIWAVAQLSTAIIVACCPLLRPVFEKMIPTRLTRTLPIPSAKARPNSIARPVTSSPLRVPATPSLTMARVPPSTIRATTRIVVLPHTSRPTSRAGCLHDGLQNSEGPVVEITRANEGEAVMCVENPLTME